MIGSAFTGRKQTNQKSRLIYLLSESSPIHGSTACGKHCINIQNRVECTVGHLQLLSHGPCQIWFPLTFTQKEKPNTIYPFGLHAILFFRGMVIFVPATKAVSGEDSQMALVTVSVRHNCSNPLSWSRLCWDTPSGDQGLEISWKFQ